MSADRASPLWPYESNRVYRRAGYAQRGSNPLMATDPPRPAHTVMSNPGSKRVASPG